MARSLRRDNGSPSSAWQYLQRPAPWFLPMSPVALRARASPTFPPWIVIVD